MVQDGQSWDWRLGLAGFLVVGSAIVLSGNCALAQNITFDGTLGQPDVLTGSIYIIPESAGQTVGSNLFHSFGRFNLDTGEVANYQSADNIRNILSRVTGGSASLIDGLIFTESPSVNLFLINPSGIVFGPNASLDVGGATRGSFVATTVDALVWPNGSQFSATNPGGANSLLTIIGDPSGFLASQRQLQPIVVSGSTLTVYEGQSLLLLGGDVNLQRSFLSVRPPKGGQVELGGVAGTGTVGLGVNGNELRLSFPDGVARADVSIFNGTNINVEADNGGSLAINARNLNISGGSILRAGIGQGLGGGGSQAGDIDINATGTIAIANSNVSNGGRANVVGDGGNINITTGSLLMTEGSKLGTGSNGIGNAGSVTIDAHELISLDGYGTAVASVLGNGVGQSGDIHITTGLLLVNNDAWIGSGTLGQGNGGNVAIDVRDTVVLNGDGHVYTLVGNTGVGQGGDLSITTKSLSMANGAFLSASTLGQGDAGSVNINATDSVSFDGVSSGGFESSAISQVNDGAVGNGGNVNITTRSLSVTNGAALAAGTTGWGNAGNVMINATDSVIFDGASSNGESSRAMSAVDSEAVGNGGNVNISTGSLSVTNRAQIITSTVGQGNAGSVTIDAHDTTTFAGESVAFSTVEATGVGRGGSITISTGALSVTDGSQLQTVTHGQGDAGSVTINARDTVSFDSGYAISRVETGAVGNGGDISITTDSLSVTNGAQLIANTLGKGNAGNVTINAHESVTFDGVSSNGFASGILSSVASEAVGNGGNITIQAESLSLTNGAHISAASLRLGVPGNIQINTSESVALKNGSSLSTFNAFGNFLYGATSQGNVWIETGRLTVQDQSDVIVSSGLGDAGNIEVIAHSVQLDNQGRFLSEALWGNGGNITLNAQDLLLLRNNSLISTTAGTAQAGGDGGNININAPFIVAVPKENSDVTANAYEGRGGNINITTQGLFGIEYRPRLTPLSDITASSEFGVNGTVAINTPGVDPSRGLAQLPTNVVDPTKLIDRHCTPTQSSDRRSSFTITGRGGLPPSPNEPLRNEEVITNWITLPSEEENHDTAPPDKSTHSTNQPLVEAQGWMINDQGQVVLTAETTTVTPQTSWLPSPSCPASQTGNR